MRANLFRICGFILVLVLSGVLLMLLFSFGHDPSLATANVLVPEIRTRLIEVDTAKTSSPRGNKTNEAVLNRLRDEFLARRNRTGIHLSKNSPGQQRTPRFPRVFVIGFAKAGTKALYEALKLHNQLNGPLKEMRYFTKHYDEALQSYIDKFPPPPPNGYTIEKSPDYIISLKAAQRLKMASLSLDLQPSTLKFVVIVRNPVARTVSEYLELMPQFPYSQTDFPTKIVNSSCYAYHINQWLTVFDSSQFCFVNGDVFILDPYLELKSLETCLGLQSYYQRYNFFLNKKRGFYCFVGSNGEGRICMNRSKGRKHPFVNSAMVEKLKDHFRPWNLKLYEMLNRTNFHWEESKLF